MSDRDTQPDVPFPSLLELLLLQQINGDRNWAYAIGEAFYQSRGYRVSSIHERLSRMVGKGWIEAHPDAGGVQIKTRYSITVRGYAAIRRGEQDAQSYTNVASTIPGPAQA